MLIQIILMKIAYISLKVFSVLDYKEQKARRYSFLLSEMPFKSLKSKLERQNSSSMVDLKEILNNTLEIKSGFLNYNK